MTREDLIALAETAEARTKAHLRAALKDPAVKAAVHGRAAPSVPGGDTAVADHGEPRARRRAGA
ncbi:hypothetical protein Q8W71_07005 [Methylobacterium sp. NEAU 140]|uniref:hypothetical protein n=1 Tax=Methylobacterium sp. NEAU 140 TaxID=3064945 RepID=UPI00273288A1|nr:hypothetical protein [Methylobacterium sp. NEAU 140]MDP4022364.1 hypothetical protein [Methylobacterium sp. NEAU 140]